MNQSQNESVSISDVLVCFLPEFNEYLMQGHDLPSPEFAHETYGLKAGTRIERQVHRVTFRHYQEREFRYGFAGQVLDRAQEIDRQTLEIEAFILRKRGGVWTWVPQ